MKKASRAGHRTDNVQLVIGKDIGRWSSGPDLLSMCEIENGMWSMRWLANVNTLLPVPRRYQVVHADTFVARGINGDSSLRKLRLEQAIFAAR